jgi:hypothetical protein
MCRPLGLWLPWAVVLLLVPACGGEVVGYDPEVDPPPDAAPLTDVGPDVDPIIPEIPCSEEGTWVYVISHDYGLYRFDPSLRQFTLIAPIDCPGLGQPFSMAVSRSAIAYILFYENSPGWSCVGMNAVDVVTGECLGLTNFDCDNPEEFALFGMGYATLGPDTGQEKLYVMRGWDQSPWLASLEPEDGTVVPLVSMGSQSQAEMTGNSRGELFGFFGWDDPKFLARIDVSTGALHDIVSIPQLSGNSATAVAYWGGDFYIFWSEAGTGDVYRVSGTTVSHHTSFPFSIVGAGVSTCAPTTTPDAGVDAGAGGE